MIARPPRSRSTARRLDTAQYADTRARRLAEREFNLSCAPNCRRPTASSAASGSDGATGPTPASRWRKASPSRCDLKLGDALTYDIAGTPVTATITSLRKVDWDSFRPNFFTLFAPGVLESMPQTYLGAVRAAGGPQSAAWLSRARAAISERARDRRRRDHAAGADDHRAGGAARSSSCSCSRCSAVCSCCRRRSRRRRTSAGSTPRSCARSAHRERSCPPRRSPSSSCWARSPERSRAAGATAIGYVLSDRVFQIPVLGQSDGLALRRGRRRARRDARRLARHARHDAAAAARGDSPAG